MPHHSHSSKGSQDCCNALFESLRLILPDIERSQTKDTCAFFTPSHNRFAYVYHRTDDHIIRTYFRGPLDEPPESEGILTIHRRDHVKEGWDRAFPYYTTISSVADSEPLAALLFETSYPLAKPKRGSPPSLEPLSDTFLEGARQILTRVGYRRAISARLACIKHYGVECWACGHSFEKTYGEIGRGYIHVHHLVEISSFNEAHRVDPVRDLRPVCPNCHAMLHRRRPAYTIDEIRSAVDLQKSSG